MSSRTVPSSFRRQYNMLNSCLHCGQVWGSFMDAHSRMQNTQYVCSQPLTIAIFGRAIGSRQMEQLPSVGPSSSPSTTFSHRGGHDPSPIVAADVARPSTSDAIKPRLLGFRACTLRCARMTHEHSAAVRRASRRRQRFRSGATNGLRHDRFKNVRGHVVLRNSVW